MRWITSILIIGMAFIGCRQEMGAENSNETPYLIEASELKELIKRSNIKIIDFRKPENYEEIHIENAINVWRSDIEDDSYDYKGMMASRSQIEKLFGDKGISSYDTIVVYDDNGLCNATRLWWILQNYDFDSVKLLHGGIESWRLIGGNVTSEVTNLTKSEFLLPHNPSMKYYCSKEDVISVNNDNVNILDTRTTDEFSGSRKKKGALKGGRISNAIHIDWAEAINYNGDNRMKSENELRSIYGSIINDDKEEVIIYCHTGVRSAHTTFVLTQLLGYKNVKNYDGSWTEWSHFNELPFEQDSLTMIFK